MSDIVPVNVGQVFGTLLYEMHGLSRELEARRKHDADVGDYLKERGIGDDFDAWRKAREERNTATASGVVES
jgi:hypothetical protein